MPEITFWMQVHAPCVSIYVPQRFGLELMRPVADSLVEEAPGTRSFSQSYFNEFQMISHPHSSTSYHILFKMSLKWSQPLPHHHLQRDFHYQQPPLSLLHHLPEKSTFFKVSLKIAYILLLENEIFNTG